MSLTPDDTLRRLRHYTLILLGIGVAARVVRYALGAAVWGDEAMLGLNVVGRDYAGLTRTLDLGQVAPIGFLWAERFVIDLLGRSEWAVRLLPFLAAVGALGLFFGIARRTVSPMAAVLAVGVLAAARWPVSMAGTLKPYSGDLFWSALLLALAVRWKQDTSKRWPLTLLAAAVPVALVMSYPVVFVAGAVAVYLLPAVWRTPGLRVKGLYAAYSLLMLGTFGGIYQHHASQAHEPRAIELDRFMHEFWAGGFPPKDPVKAGVWLLEVHTGRLMAFPIGDRNAGSTLTFLLFLGGVWGCWKARQRGLLVLCLLPMALNLLAAVLDKYPYGACCRLSQHLAPGICLMIGSGWAALIERVGPGTVMQRLAAAVVTLGTIGVAQIGFDLYHPEQGEGGAAWARGISREVGRNLRPGDVVVIGSNGGITDASFEWYAARLNGVRAGDFLSKPAPPAGRVWLVVLGANFVQPAEEQRLTAALAGWETLDRVEYRLPPGWNGVNLTCAVRCLAPAGSAAEKPGLRVFP